MTGGNQSFTKSELPSIPAAPWNVQKTNRDVLVHVGGWKQLVNHWWKDCTDITNKSQINYTAASTLRLLCNVKSNVIRRQAALWNSLWAPLVHEVPVAPRHPWHPVETQRSISVTHRGYNQRRMLLRKATPWQNTVSFELDSLPRSSTEHYLHTMGLIKHNAFISSGELSSCFYLMCTSLDNLHVFLMHFLYYIFFLNSTNMSDHSWFIQALIISVSQAYMHQNTSSVSCSIPPLLASGRQRK